MEFKLPKRFKNSNKSDYGRVLNIAGSDYMPGAAYLSSASALKIGCGYCYLHTTEQVKNIVATQNPNIVYVPSNELINKIQEADVIAIGCGLSTKETSIKLFEQVIKNKPNNTKIIIDADGINILAKLEINNIPNLILTPHPKEAARLLNTNIENILSKPEDNAHRIARKYNATIALKTHNTIICDTNNNYHINTSGNSALAKAGSGDILTGMIAGLLSQRLNNFDAVKTSVFLHGLCGEIASQKLTEYCVLGDDIINAIPEAIKTIL